MRCGNVRDARQPKILPPKIDFGCVVVVDLLVDDVVGVDGRLGGIEDGVRVACGMEGHVDALPVAVDDDAGAASL